MRNFANNILLAEIMLEIEDMSYAQLLFFKEHNMTGKYASMSDIKMKKILDILQILNLNIKERNNLKKYLNKYVKDFENKYIRNLRT